MIGNEELDELLNSDIEVCEIASFLKRYICNFKSNLKRVQPKDNPLISYTNFTDNIIKFIYKISILQTEETVANSVSLVAQGSWARKEICPYSDVDIMFVYKGKKSEELEKFIQTYLYFAWDCGIDLKHRVHEISDIIEASKDISIKTAMVESRFICGSDFISNEAKSKIEKLKKIHMRNFVTKKLEEIQKRKKLYPFSMEVNLKQTSGGLRDYHALLWIANVVLDIENLNDLPLNYIKDKDLKEFKKSINFINRVRFFLHVESEKKQDILLLELIPQIASYFNQTQMKFSKEVFKSLWNIKFNSQMIIQQIKDNIKDEKSEKLGLLFYKKGDVIYAKSDEKITNLNDLLRFFINLEDRKYSFNISVVNALKNEKENFKMSKENYVQFSKLFYKTYLNQLLYLFYKSTLFPLFFPSLKHIIYLPQFDGYHTYPVGIHTLKTLLALENIDDMFVKSLYDDLCERGKYLLKIILLFHDSGKGKGGNHHLKSAKLFKLYCKKIDLNLDMIAVGDRLIRHHDLMSKVANSKDIYSEKVIFSFLATIKDEQSLRMLYILTYCDIKGVGKKHYTYFNSRLIRELYEISLKYFDKNTLIDEAQRKRKKIQILREYSGFNELNKKQQKSILSINSNLFFIKFSPNQIVNISTLAFETTKINFIIENSDSLTITLVRKNDINITHILKKLSYLNILEMEIFDLFDDLKYFKIYFHDCVEKSDIYLIQKLLHDAIHLPLKAPTHVPLIEKKDFRLDCEHSKTYALMNLNTKDQKGLIAYIMYIFDKYGIKITSAKIQTIKKRTKNIFLIEKQGILCENKGEIMNLLYTYTKTKGQNKKCAE